MKFEKLQFKRGTSAEWDSSNPILASGEPGYNISNNTMKVGDGQNPWSVIPVINFASTYNGIIGDDLNISNYSIIGSGAVAISGLISSDVGFSGDGSLLTGIPKTNSTPDMSGVPFVGQLAGTDGGLDTDSLFTYSDTDSKLFVQKIKANLVFRAYANTASVPSPETWEVVMDLSNNLPVWYDGAAWRDFAGNIV